MSKDLSDRSSPRSSDTTQNTLEGAVNPPTRSQGTASPTRCATTTQQGIHSVANLELEKQDHPPSFEAPLIVSNVWADDVAVEFVPRFLPLDRTHVKLKLNDSVLKTLLKDLQRCFYSMSFQVTYDNEPLSAHILTWENGEIHVDIWKTRRDSTSAQADNEEEQLVVNVRQGLGDAIEFHKYSQLILEAATGPFNAQAYKEWVGQEMDIKHIKSAEVEIRRDRNNVEEPVNDEEERVKESVKSALETVHFLLTSARVDAKIAGMKSLCVLVNPRKSGVSTSIHVSHAILLGAGPNEEGSFHKYQVIRDYIVKVIQKRDIGAEGTENENDTHRNVTTGVHDIADDEEEVQLQSPLSLMVNLSLEALFNALEVVWNLQELLETENEHTSPTDILNAYVAHAHDTSDKELLSTLLQQVDSATQEPHIACRSAMVLRLFCKASQVFRQVVIELQGIDAATAACNYGADHHAKLEEESKYLRQTLLSHEPP